MKQDDYFQVNFGRSRQFQMRVFCEQKQQFRNGDFEYSNFEINFEKKCEEFVFMTE